jgi:hypothetical protein
MSTKDKFTKEKGTRVLLGVWLTSWVRKGATAKRERKGALSYKQQENNQRERVKRENKQTPPQAAPQVYLNVWAQRVCLRRQPSKRNREDASEVAPWGGRRSRVGTEVGANPNVIINKMTRSGSSREGRTKRVTCEGPSGWRMGVYCCFAKVYSWFFAGARGLN